MESYKLLATSYMSNGQYINAVGIYKKLLLYKPKDSYLHYSLACAYLKSGQEEFFTCELKVAYELAVSQGNTYLQEKIERHVEQLAK
ncbi:MAG: hypothetical protein BWY64_04040 [bacterium ADurb.Bin363]|nr:MAG: hypothetical protein BWY64_04040 [bacterium ADurb.Bin363]